MKLTKSQLKRIIKEEIAAVLSETQRVRDDSWRDDPLGARVARAKEHIVAGGTIDSFIDLAIAGGDIDLEESDDMRKALRDAIYGGGGGGGGGSAEAPTRSSYRHQPPDRPETYPGEFKARYMEETKK